MRKEVYNYLQAVFSNIYVTGLVVLRLDQSMTILSIYIDTQVTRIATSISKARDAQYICEMLNY